MTSKGQRSRRSQRDHILSNDHFERHFLTCLRTAWTYFNETYPQLLITTAGFTLSRALLRKKCRGPSSGAADPIFPPEKNWRPLFTHHCRFYSLRLFTRVSPIISAKQKNCRSSCGGRGPCSAERVEHA